MTVCKLALHRLTSSAPLKNASLRYILNISNGTKFCRKVPADMIFFRSKVLHTFTETQILSYLVYPNFYVQEWK